MFDLMKKMLQRALKESECEQAEIYGERGDVLSVDLERSEVKKVKHIKSTGVGVRVVVSKKIGFSYTTALDEASVEKCVEQAVKQARVSEQDPDFPGLPAPAAASKRKRSNRYTKPEKTFDARIVELLGSEGGCEDAIKCCREMLAGTEECEVSRGVSRGVRRGVKCSPTEGSFAAAHSETFVLNSEGVEASDAGTFVSAGIAVVASENKGEETSGWESKASRALSELDFQWVGREAVKMAVGSLGGKRLKTAEIPVVFSPRALQSLFAYTLIPQLNAENVQRKQSPYHDKKGEVVGSEILTIVDDGTTPSGLNSRKMDGEGVPSQATTLVENGVLKNFLYDSYTAAKDDTESTGNATRGFDNLPSPGATNFILSGGGGSGSRRGSRASKEEMLGEIREGLFVSDLIGAHTASRASGDFSVVAQNAFGVRNGELYPVAQVMLSGNTQEVLRRVELFGTDTRQIYNLVSPSVKVSKVQVVS